MPIQLTCDCNRLLRVRDEFAGKKVRCPDCKQVINVPAAEAPPLVAELLESPPSPVMSTPPRPRTGPPPLPQEEASFDITERPPMALSNRAPRKYDTNFDDDEDDDRDEDEDRRPRKKKRKSVKSRSALSSSSSRGEGGFGSTGAGIAGGLLMIVIAVVWFVVGLSFNLIFYYPPILLVLGIIAIVKGLVSR